MATLVTELVAESVIHTWDLATAVGRAVTFDEDAVSVAHAGLMLGESSAPLALHAPPPSVGATNNLERLVERSGRRLA